MSAEVKPGYKQTEVGVIPEDWDVKSLEHITDPKRPVSYGIVQTGRHIENGISCVRVIDLVNGRINKDDLIKTSKEISTSYKRTVLSRGDLVIALRGKIGELAVIEDNLVGANLTRRVALIALLPGHDNHYLYYYLSSPASKKIFERNLNGSALQEIPIGTLRNISAVLPPFPEQRAIAATLSDVDALLTALDRLIAKKRDIKRATMQELLTGKRQLPEFNGEWEIAEFGELTSPRKERIDPRLGGKPSLCIELEHIAPETGRLIGSTITNELSSLKSVFYPGDVLFGKLRAYLRKYWIADRRGVCSTEIWVFSPSARIMSEYLFQIAKTDQFIEAASTAYGTHMPRSDWNVVRHHKIPLPLLEEQSAVASILSDMDAEIATLEARHEKTRALKQGMMQELLTGRIRLV